MGYTSVLVPWAALIIHPILAGTCPTAPASAAPRGKVRAASTMPLCSKHCLFRVMNVVLTQLHIPSSSG